VMLSQDQATFLAEKHLATDPDRGPARRRRLDAVDVVTGASYRPGTEIPGSVQVAEIWRDRSGPNADVTHAACRAFCQTLRYGTPPTADVQSGWASATAVAIANRAVDEGRRLTVREYLTL
jgi:hypothetical protein